MNSTRLAARSSLLKVAYELEDKGSTLNIGFSFGFVATWNVSQAAALPGFGYYSSQTGNAKAETPAVALLFVCKTVEDDGDSFIC